PLKKEYQHYISGLGIAEPLMEINNENSEKIEKFRNKGIEEIFWGHFLATLKFWMEDTSSSFEKTDIFIEKSVDTSFALLEVQPLKKILDLGKFLFKEKFKTN
ncbi:MAG: TetR/AcrR family transcriptional regulator, partial [Kaistella sp.]